MTDTITKFDAAKLKASLAAYEKEQGEKIDYSNDEEMLYVYSHLNTDDDLGLGISFDTVSGVVQQGGQDTTMCTCYSGTLGHSFIVSWEVQTNFKSRAEFLVFVEGLHQDAMLALKKINRLLK